jgi:hypothetical protein
MSIIDTTTSNNSNAVTRWHVTDEKPGEIISQKTFDRDVAIESATKIRNEIDQRGRELVLGARFPIELIFQLKMEGKITDDEFVNGALVLNRDKLNKLLNGEYSKLKCIDGQL